MIGIGKLHAVVVSTVVYLLRDATRRILLRITIDGWSLRSEWDTLGPWVDWAMASIHAKSTTGMCCGIFTLYVDSTTSDEHYYRGVCYRGMGACCSSDVNFGVRTAGSLVMFRWHGDGVRDTIDESPDGWAVLCTIPSEVRVRWTSFAFEHATVGHEGDVSTGCACFCAEWRGMLDVCCSPEWSCCVAMGTVGADVTPVCCSLLDVYATAPRIDSIWSEGVCVYVCERPGLDARDHVTYSWHGWFDGVTCVPEVDLVLGWKTSHRADTSNEGAYSDGADVTATSCVIISLYAHS